MIAELLKVAKSLVTLADDLQRYHAELQKIREELRDLTIIVHALAQDNKNTKERNEQERQRLLLELENKLLKFERQLPAARGAKKASKKLTKK